LAGSWRKSEESLTSIHHVRPRAGMVGRVSLKWLGGVSCLSAAWYYDAGTRLESGPVTADLTTTVVHSYINC